MWFPSWLRNRKRHGVPRKRLAFRPWLEALEDRLTPSTLTVTSPLDDGSSGTLRSAIAAAQSGDTINFDSSLSGSTINLDPAKGELFVNQNLNFVGLGAANLAISGQNQVRVFDFPAGTTDAVSGLTVENGFGSFNLGGGILNNGNLTVDGCTLTGNSANSGGGIGNDYLGYLTVTDSKFLNNSGGGIADLGYSLTVSGCTLSNNSAAYGGGISGGNSVTVSACTLSNNLGGGIDIGQGTLLLTNSTLSGNSSLVPWGDGGGLKILTGTATVYNCNFLCNSGAGIFNFGAALAVNGGYVSDNSGGGIYNGFSGVATLSGTKLRCNTGVVDIGGGIGNNGILTAVDCLLDRNSSFFGGGINNGVNGTVTLNNCLLSNNSAEFSGGGIYSLSSNTTLIGCTLTGNSAARGGGIESSQTFFTTLTVAGCTLTGNSASIAGGGIESASSTPGSVNLYITNSTVCGNSAPIGADLAYFNPGSAVLTSSDVCAIARPTVATITSSTPSPVLGQAVTFTVTVTAPDGVGTPTGTVTFVDTSSPFHLGTVTLDSSGQATITTSALSVGDQLVVVIYNGAANFTPSVGTVEQNVMSAQQALGQIIDQVNALVTAGTISSGNGNALIVKLNNAITSLNKDNTTTAAIGQMNAFINQTQAFLSAGKLQNSDEQTLIADVDQVITAVLDAAI
jgi:hypothetical protein